MLTIYFQSSDVSDDSESEDYPIFTGTSTASSSEPFIRKPQTFPKPTADNHSDSEESFASLHSDDVDLSDDEDEPKKEPSEK